jgi:flagellar biosynthetic protein FliR
MSQLLTILATLLFLATDCHHDLIALFVRSYEIAPFGASDPAVMVREGIALVSKTFVLAVKVGAPIVVGVVTLNIMLGFIVKATPQINIFFIGFPLYIALGFFILMLGLPAYILLFGGSLSEMRFEAARIIEMAGR